MTSSRFIDFCNGVFVLAVLLLVLFGVSQCTFLGKFAEAAEILFRLYLGFGLLGLAGCALFAFAEAA